MDGPHGLDSEPSGKDAIEGGRRATSLDVPERRDPRFVTGPMFDLFGKPSPDAAQSGMTELVGDVAGGGVTRRVVIRALPGSAPSETTTIDENWPPACRRRSRSQTSSRSKGTSGTRISAAPPAIPAYVAIHPAWRPITSQTMTR